jgi:hypothetical protein
MFSLVQSWLCHHLQAIMDRKGILTYLDLPNKATSPSYKQWAINIKGIYDIIILSQTFNL